MRPNTLMPIMTFMTKYYHSFKLPNRSVSGSHNFINIFHLALLVMTVFFVSSCEKGPTFIGNGIFPTRDFVEIKSIDTLSVRSFTMFNDSVRTDSPSISYLGELYDPYFGTTSAEFVTQIRLGSTWDDLSFHIDSVRLNLTLTNVHGSVSGTHSLRIAEITDMIYTDSAYYSNKKVNADTLNEILIDLPTLRADTINNIAINVPVDFGKRITRDTAKLFYNNTVSDFRTYFKGLYFRLTSGSDPLLLSLILRPSSSTAAYNNYFTLFMHDDDNVYKSFILVIDATNQNASYNRFIHNFSTATLGNKMVHRNDTRYLDTLSYLQCLNGVYTKIVLPGLANIKNNSSFKGIAINKARLIVPVYYDGYLYTPLTAPTQLYLRYRDYTGTRYYVPDYSISTSFFDGVKDTTANVYNFNIPAFVQGYLEDATGLEKPELDIFQGTTGTTNAIMRANSSKTPVKFEFTYTKF